MCQATDGALAGGESPVLARRTEVVHVPMQAGIQPSPLTALALLDTAITILTVHEVPADAIHTRVTSALAAAEALKATLFETRTH